MMDNLRFIFVLKKASLAFKKNPDIFESTAGGLCAYFKYEHNLVNKDIMLLLNLVPGINFKGGYMFGNNRPQDQIPKWQWRQRRERSNWCKKAIKEINKEDAARIVILKQARKAFKKRPKIKLKNAHGVCHYLLKVHNLPMDEVRTLLKLVPGVDSKITWFMFAQKRPQSDIPRTEWCDCRERSRWCTKAIKILEERM